MICDGDLLDAIGDLPDAELCRPVSFPEARADCAYRIRACPPDADAIVQPYAPSWFRAPGQTVLIATRPGRRYHDVVFVKSEPLCGCQVARVERVYDSGAIDQLSTGGFYPDDPALTGLVSAFVEEDEQE